MSQCRIKSLALLMVVVYSLIALSPVAPAALAFPVIAHAVTGICAGDFDICGCSPERRASRTCCCWMKKKREQEQRQRQSQACHEDKRPHCCGGNRIDSGREREHANRDVSTREEAEAAELRCAPCKGLPHFTITGIGEYQHMPHRFTTNLFPPPGKKLALTGPLGFPSLHREPPDPPPKYSFLS